jgi:hypothetical protein
MDSVETLSAARLSEGAKEAHARLPQSSEVWELRAKLASREAIRNSLNDLKEHATQRLKLAIAQRDELLETKERLEGELHALTSTEPA